MNVTELMKPRYKVIADYPGNEYPIGVVIDELLFDGKTSDWFERYPALFEKLKWWAYRREEEMPLFLRRISPDCQYGSKILVGDVIKAAWYKSPYFTNFDNHYPRMYQAIEVHGEYMFYDTHCFIPASKEEYEEAQAKTNTNGSDVE